MRHLLCGVVVAALVFVFTSAAEADALLNNGDLTVSPIDRGPNLYRENSPSHDLWYFQDSNDPAIFYDAENDWLENNSDVRRYSSLYYCRSDNGANAGNLTLAVTYTNDEIVTGGGNTQQITLDVFGVDSGWGVPDNFNISKSGLDGYAGNAVALLTDVVDLSTSQLTPTTYTSDPFNASPGYDYLFIRLRMLGVGAATATEEFIRIHSVGMVPEPGSLVVMVAGVVGSILRRRGR